MSSSVKKELLLWIGFVLFLMGIGTIVAIFYKIYQVWFGESTMDYISWIFMIIAALSFVLSGYQLLKDNK